MHEAIVFGEAVHVSVLTRSGHDHNLLASRVVEQVQENQEHMHCTDDAGGVGVVLTTARSGLFGAMTKIGPKRNSLVDDFISHPAAGMTNVHMRTHCSGAFGSLLDASISPAHSFSLSL